jgi:hypothetical protein
MVSWYAEDEVFAEYIDKVEDTDLGQQREGAGIEPVPKGNLLQSLHSNLGKVGQGQRRHDSYL